MEQKIAFWGLMLLVAFFIGVVLIADEVISRLICALIITVLMYALYAYSGIIGF